MPSFFLSHSSNDSVAAGLLKDWIQAQGFETPFLHFDPESGLSPGVDWEQELYRAIEQSQALLVLYSLHWEASKWCFAEFAQARWLGKPILPVIDSGDLDFRQVSIAHDLQLLDLRHDREAGLQQLACRLREIALDAQSGFAWDAQRSPYPGMLAFEEEDAAIYFGRDLEVRQLIERLTARRTLGGIRLVALVGSSGSGKSSLLRAGVIPRLRRAGHQWLPLPPFRPQGQPCQEFARSLALACGRGSEWRDIHQGLLRAEAEGHLSTLLAEFVADLRTAAGGNEAQILISIDQAEEMFSLVEQEEACRFWRLISTSLAGDLPFLGVMTLRSDFLGRLQAAEALTVRFETMPLAPMPIARIPQIIEGPARVAGLRVDAELVQLASREAALADALPLLAFALRELYDRHGADQHLSLTDYLSLGDAKAGVTPLENAVRRAADRVIVEGQHSSEALVALRAAFVTAMVRVNEQGDYVRRPALWNDLPPQAWPLLEMLVNGRLLQSRTMTIEGTRLVEVAHEALLRKWPLLRGWLDEARDVLIGTQELEPDLRQWLQAEVRQKEAALLSGLKLTRAQVWLQETPQQFPQPLKSYVQASLDHRDQQVRRRRRTVTSILAGLGTLTLLAISAWGWGVWKAKAAREAETRQFLSSHLMLLERDPQQSLIHGLAAMNRVQGQINEALPLAVSLEKAANNNFLKGVLPSGQRQVWSLAETPAGRLISGGSDGSVRFWNPDGTAQGEVIQTSHSRGVVGLMALDEERWWSAGDEGSLQLWSGRTRVGRAIATGHGSLKTMVRDRNGDLITAGSDGLLRRWDANSGKSRGAPIESGHNEVWSMAVLPDGDWVTGGREGTIRWWKQGRASGPAIASSQGAVTALMAFSNTTILSGGDDGSVNRWDGKRRLRATYKSGHSTVQVLLLRRNRTVVSGGSEPLMEGKKNYLRVWDPGSKIDNDDSTIAKAAYLSVVELSNGDLLSGSSEGILQHWRQGRPLGPAVQTGHGPIYALNLTGEGDLVSAGDDGMIRIWQYGHLVVSFSTEQKGVTSLLILPDRTLWSGGRDGSIKQWTAQGRRTNTPVIQTHHGAVWAIAQLQNGDLVSGGDDGNLRQWHQGKQVAFYNTPHNTVVSLLIRNNGDWVTGGSGGELQIWRNGKPLGAPFPTGFGSLWMLIDRKDGSLVSANGDGSITNYPLPAQSIGRACKQLKDTSDPDITADPDIFGIGPSRGTALTEARQLCSPLLLVKLKR